MFLLDLKYLATSPFQDYVFVYCSMFHVTFLLRKFSSKFIAIAVRLKKYSLYLPSTFLKRMHVFFYKPLDCKTGKTFKFINTFYLQQLTNLVENWFFFLILYQLFCKLFSSIENSILHFHLLQ